MCPELWKQIHNIVERIIKIIAYWMSADSDKSTTEEQHSSQSGTDFVECTIFLNSKSHVSQQTATIQL